MVFTNQFLVQCSDMFKMRCLLFIVFILMVIIISIAMLCYVDYKSSENVYCVTYTPSGTIRGDYNTTRLGRKFESYRGIRYAEPPIGGLRFQPPKLIQEYRDQVDATKDGPVCPQANFSWPFQFMDEDCLTINVYTPLKKDRPDLLPVIVYIHQSAFYIGAACSYFYGPLYLLDHDIVLVTFNYRIGSLGFISTGDEIAPGNNGFKDQVVALRWVQRNIAAFGGDPNCVTLAGYSSGSTSVALHLVSPMSKGLFHRAISMSGSPTTPETTQTHLHEYAVKQAQLVNCSTYNSKLMIECLKSKPWKDISKTYNDFYTFGNNPKHLWQPIIEKDFGQERFLTMDPIDVIKDGHINDVPYIISQNEDEYLPYAAPFFENDTLLRQLNEDWDKKAPVVFLLPAENLAALSELRRVYFQNQPVLKDEENLIRLSNLYSDSVIAFPVHRLAQLMCRYSPKPVWYLYFTYVGNNSFYKDPTTGKPKYAVHQDEILYLFDVQYRFPKIGTTGEDAQMVDRLTAIWYNFAKYGDPNPKESTTELKGLVWPAMTPNIRTYLQLSNDLTLHQNLKEERMQIWEQLYPIQY